MLEDIKYLLYAEILVSCLKDLKSAIEKEDSRLIKIYHQRALRIGNRILGLENKLGIKEKDSIKDILDVIKRTEYD